MIIKPSESKFCHFPHNFDRYVMNFLFSLIGRIEAYGNVDFFFPNHGLLTAGAEHTACCGYIAETIINIERFPVIRDDENGRVEGYVGGAFYDNTIPIVGSFDVEL